MNGICPEYLWRGWGGGVRFSDLTILTLLSVDRIEYLWPHRQGIEHTTCLLSGKLSGIQIIFSDMRPWSLGRKGWVVCPNPNPFYYMEPLLLCL